MTRRDLAAAEREAIRAALLALAPADRAEVLQGLDTTPTVIRITRKVISPLRPCPSCGAEPPRDG